MLQTKSSTSLTLSTMKSSNPKTPKPPRLSFSSVCLETIQLRSFMSSIGESKLDSIVKSTESTSESIATGPLEHIQTLNPFESEESMDERFIFLHYLAYDGVTYKFRESYEVYSKSGWAWDSRKYSSVRVLNDTSYLLQCMVSGCKNNFEFAKFICYDFEETFNIQIVKCGKSFTLYQCISERFAQSGYIDSKVINNYPPLILWYPDVTTYETCEALLKANFVKTRYSVALLCVFKNWVGLYNKLNVRTETSLYWASKNLNRTEIFSDQAFTTPEMGQLDILRFCTHRVIFGGRKSYWNFSPSDFSLDLFFSVEPRHFIRDRRQFVPLDFTRKRAEPGDCPSIPSSVFESTFLRMVLADDNIDLTLNENEEEVDKSKILRDTLYATKVFKTYPARFGKHCVSRFITVGMVDDAMIYEFKPFYICYPPYFYYDVYEELLTKFKYLEYCIGKAVIMSYNNNVYFEHGFKPEVELLRSAAKSGNKAVFDDQKSKARALGKYYRYLDMENECVLDRPSEVPYDQVNFELDLDWEFCLGITF